MKQVVEVVGMINAIKIKTLCTQIKHIAVILLFAVLVSACGGGEGTAIGDQGSYNQSEIVGESVVLYGQTEVQLRRPLLFVRKVWGVNSLGYRIDFIEDQDWTKNNNGISRTSNSRIPDFSNYSVALSSDRRFSFSSDPRNPPIIIPYQIYVDYVSTYPDVEIIPAQNAKLPSKVVCLGDSISAGAHTIASYFNNEDSDSYCGLLRTFLGSTAQVSNPSILGGTLKQAISIFPAIIESKPDLLIIEFGMNDHVFFASDGLMAFELDLEKSVRSALDSGIKVILMGFFQQNAEWELEDPLMTKIYNQAIMNVANRMQVPFIDIEKFFTRSAPSERMIEFLTGDFMHHPNNYGHRIYFSLLLPHILENPVKASSIPAYVNLN